jgi:CheY-like chemotaxis protein
MTCSGKRRTIAQELPMGAPFGKHGVIGRTAFQACRLPQGPSNEDCGAWPGPADHQGNDMREVVLYVEDHPVNVLLMQTVFELRPELDLVVAVDGESAMEATTKVRPALLLLDLRLPDCHGTDLLERMRLIPGWQQIPAIAVTAEAEFMPTGTSFCDVWHKPLRVPTLLTRLDRVLAPKAKPDERSTLRRPSMFARTTFAT